MGWNHNNQYHPLLLRNLPARRLQALDVGCGGGEFALKLAPHFENVEAIDISDTMIEQASSLRPMPANVGFRVVDFLDEDFVSNGYDFVSCISVIHHMPLLEALRRLKEILRPGGRLAIIGCYKEQSIRDYFYSAIAAPANLAYSWCKGGYEVVSAPTNSSNQTLKEVVASAEEVLPGAAVKRLLFWRYLLLYTKPELTSKD